MTYLIKNGKIIDGSGGAPYIGDVLIRDGAIAPPGPAEDAVEIDASGLCVSPGFIDIHRHADLAVLRDADFGEIELAQGITTIVNGNCGLAPVPATEKSRETMLDYIEPCLGRADGFELSGFGEYMDALDSARLPINIGMLLATGTATAAAKGFTSAPFDDETLREAINITEAALNAGALGVSSGILYTPECYTGRGQLAKLVECAGRRGRVMTCHVRLEGSKLVESVEEALDIAGRAGAPLHISHFKATGRENWNWLMARAIEKIDEARAAGRDVTVDFYPYHFSATTLMSLLPPDFLAGGREAAVAALKSERGRARLLDIVRSSPEGWEDQSLALGWERVYLSSVVTEANRDIEGLSIAEIAKLRGVDGWQAVAEIIGEERGKAGVIQYSMSEDDVELAARLPYSLLISDSLYSGADKPHPRLYGSFPRMLRLYVREKRIMPIERAIMKMTSLPAARMTINDRGLIREGYRADICVFDAESITDRATFEQPRQLCEGVKYVFVNGEKAWDAGGMTAAAGGTLIRA